jgi:ABC-type branched-subunit amino acid transport system ATPase component
VLVKLTTIPKGKAMFDKLTIEDNVNECDAYHAAREHFDSLEPEDICFDCCEYPENCECL